MQWDDERVSATGFSTKYWEKSDKKLERRRVSIEQADLSQVPIPVTRVSNRRGGWGDLDQVASLELLYSFGATTARVMASLPLRL